MLNKQAIIKGLYKELEGTDDETLNKVKKYVLGLTEGLENEMTEYMMGKPVTDTDDLEGFPIGDGTLRRLPRDSQGNLLRKFKTKKHTYTILNPETEISFERHSEFEKIQLSFGFAKPFPVFVDSLKQIKLEQLKNQKPEVSRDNTITICNALMDGIVEKSQQRFSVIFYAAAMLVTREDEKLNAPLSDEMMTEKLEDLSSYYCAADFFFLLSERISGFLHIYQKLHDQKAKVLKVVQDLNSMENATLSDKKKEG